MLGPVECPQDIDCIALPYVTFNQRFAHSFVCTKTTGASPGSRRWRAGCTRVAHRFDGNSSWQDGGGRSRGGRSQVVFCTGLVTDFGLAVTEFGPVLL